MPALLLAGLLLCAPVSAETHRLPLFVPSTPSGDQGLLRVLNESEL